MESKIKSREISEKGHKKDKDTSRFKNLPNGFLKSPVPPRKHTWHIHDHRTNQMFMLTNLIWSLFPSRKHKTFSSLNKETKGKVRA